MPTQTESTQEHQTGLLSKPSIDTTTAVVELLAYTNDRPGVTITETDAHSCGRLGCRNADTRHWRVEITGSRNRTLCPEHVLEFVDQEVGLDE